MKRLIGALLLAATALAQTNPASIAAHQWRRQHDRAIVDEIMRIQNLWDRIELMAALITM